jgi:hypothetical protein
MPHATGTVLTLQRTLTSRVTVVPFLRDAAETELVVAVTANSGVYCDVMPRIW